jgi:hypothetical protein
LRKYFPEDLRTKKEVEFLNLKQENRSVAEYVAKFEELSRFCPYINAEDAMVSKCVKFESGLRPISISICVFRRSETLTLWCTSVVCFMMSGGLKLIITRLSMIRKGRVMDLGNRIARTKERRKNLVEALSRLLLRSGALSVAHWVILLMIARSERVATSVGRGGHKAYECTYVEKEITCYNCGEKGHISTKCTKPKKVAGKVFALNAEEVEHPDNLI